MKISPSLEHYLESIFILQRKKRTVRLKDIAEYINVTAPSALEALDNLKKKKLIIHEPYGDITLTKDGEKIAKKLYNRHQTLKKFFHNVLKVKEDIAEEDACKVEHYLSKETIKRILTFTKKYRS